MDLLRLLNDGGVNGGVKLDELLFDAIKKQSWFECTCTFRDPTKESEIDTTILENTFGFWCYRISWSR